MLSSNMSRTALAVVRPNQWAAGSGFVLSTMCIGRQ
jgi:hypothetical protein